MPIMEEFDLIEIGTYPARLAAAANRRMGMAPT